MSHETPDRWCILKINQGGWHYRVLMGWHGEYLYGESWRLNSGIVLANEDGDLVTFHGNSGSMYPCFLNREGAMDKIVVQFKKQLGDDNVVHVSYEEFKNVPVEEYDENKKENSTM